MRQNGNALFLILIAVALFAALSYAVTSSGRGSASVTKEKNVIEAARIIDQAGLVEQTISRLRLINGCSDTQISFENTVVTGYTNGSAPADRKCHVFDPAGGALGWPDIPAATNTALPYLFTGSVIMKNIGTGVFPPAPPTADGVELAMFLPINSLELCLELNRKLGLPVTSLGVDWSPNIKFAGAYSVSNLFPDDGGTVTPFYGARSGCLQTYAGYYPLTSGASWFFFHVLIAR